MSEKSATGVAGGRRFYVQIRSAGLSLRQIERITGTGKSTVHYALRT